MTERYGIKEEHWQKLTKIFAKNPEIRKVILFGSRALNTFQKGSDIDIALVGNKKNLNDDLGRIHRDYEDLYLPWKLDLVVYDGIYNSELRDHIDRVGICLWEK